MANVIISHLILYIIILKAGLSFIKRRIALLILSIHLLSIYHNKGIELLRVRSILPLAMPFFFTLLLGNMQASLHCPRLLERLATPAFLSLGNLQVRLHCPRLPERLISIRSNSSQCSYGNTIIPLLSLYQTYSVKSHTLLIFPLT